MPYTASAPNLPANVRKRPLRSRRRWAATWNSIFRKTGDEGQAFAIANAGLVGEKADRFLEEIVTQDEFWTEYRAELMPVVEAIWRGAFVAGAAIAEASRPFRVTWGFKEIEVEAINQAADVFIARYRAKWWDRLQRTQEDALREAIQEARAQGLQPREVAALIAPQFGKERALRIAITEITNALGQGAQAQFKLEGYATWEWRTAEDDRVCPICAPRDGESFPMTTHFEAAHARCRCWVVPGELHPHLAPMAEIA